MVTTFAKDPVSTLKQNQEVHPVLYPYPYPYPQVFTRSHYCTLDAFATSERITRLLGDLRQSGLVQIDRKKITVLDPIALAKRFS